MVNLNVKSASNDLRTRNQEVCLLCQHPGRVIHAALQDQLYGVAGNWSLRQCENSDCHLVWLDPVLVEEDIGQAYASYFTHDSGFNSVRYRLRQQIKRGYAGLAYGYKKINFLERLLTLPILAMPALKEQVIYSGFMYLRGEQTGKVLEIGFGNGNLLNNLRALGWETEGIDFDPGAVKSAQELYGLNVKWGALESQRYADNTFDAIVMSHVIEHLHDPIALIRECYRILKPQGRLVISTPNIESLGYQTFQSAWLSLDPPRHLYLFSVKTLRQLTEQCGFHISFLKTSSRGAGSIWYASTKIKQTQQAQAEKTTTRLMPFQAKWFEWQESRKLRQSANVGEELVLLAQKL